MCSVLVRSLRTKTIFEKIRNKQQPSSQISSIMNYESSYESGQQPFRPDTKRGYWASPIDFTIISIALVFRIDIVMDFVFGVLHDSADILTIFTYLIAMVVYVVPMMVLQSFLGQFSSSGFISALRISPLFKGMGYVSLMVNFVTLSYYGIFASLPLIMIYTSFLQIATGNGVHPNIRCVTTNNCTKFNVKCEYDNYMGPYNFFLNASAINCNDLETWHLSNEISWQAWFCTAATWAIIAYVLIKYIETEKFGRMLRYVISAAIALLLLCFVRVLFLPTAGDTLLHKFVSLDMWSGISKEVLMLTHFTASFGPGHGVMIALASFNRFRTNIVRNSWHITFGQFAIFIVFNVMITILKKEFYGIDATDLSGFREWHTYFLPATVFSSLEIPHFWIIAFYAMLWLFAWTLIITQLFAILVSVFDDFERLRQRKCEFIFGTIAVLLLASTYFCTYVGVQSYSALIHDVIFAQCSLNLLLLFVVLWIYGRERFQRDFEFMLEQRFASWKVTLLRYLVPTFLVFTMMISFFGLIFSNDIESPIIYVGAVLLLILPWISIPTFAVIKMRQVLRGSLWSRLKSTSRPTDWCPVEAEYRQQYETDMGNMELTHQLTVAAEKAI